MRISKRVLALLLTIALLGGAVPIAPTVAATTIPNNAEATYAMGADAFKAADPAVFGDAKWIWDAADDGAGNRWMALRKDVTLSAADLGGTVTARIAADTKYWLWINGRMAVYEGQLKRGAALLEKDVYATPEAGQPDMAVMKEEIATYFDEVDITPYLQAGKNTIVALVWYFGNSGHSHVDSGQGAFLFHSEMGSVTVDSDATWVTHRHMDYQPSDNIGKATAGARQEYYIVYDAREGFTGFEQPDFDVSDWTAAEELGKAGDKPWNELWPRSIPEWKVWDRTAYTLEDSHVTVQSATDTETVYRISLPTNIHFSPYLKVKAVAGKTIRFDVPNLAKDYQTYTTRGGENGEAVEQAWESPAWINWWYVDVTVPAGVEVLELGYRQTGYNAEIVGTFDSDSDFYDSVWQHCVDSAYVNMRDTVMDCPDRERCPWAGDACYTMYASLYFLDDGGHDLIRRMASTYVNWQSEAGIIPTTAPCTFAWNEWAELPSQSMRLMNFLWTYYEYTGDRALLEETYEPLKKYIATFDLEAAEYTSPFLRGVGTNTVHENWIDWATYTDTDLFMNICAYNLVKTAVNYATVLGDDAGLAKYAPLEEGMRLKFDEYFWTEKGYRSPNYQKATLDERSNALAVVAGLVSPDKYPIIKDMLVAGSDASPGTITHIVEALGVMGYPDEMMQRIYKSYKGEIQNDRPTLGESWNSSKSTNHGWGSGTLAVLGGYIAGVRPLSAGYDEMLIAPMLSSELTTLNTTVSTVKGAVPVTVTKGDTYTLTTTVPADTRAKIGVERQGDMAVYCGDTLLWNGGAVDFAVDGLSFAGTDDRFVYFYAEPGGWTFTTAAAVKTDKDTYTLAVDDMVGGTVSVNGNAVTLPYSGTFAAEETVTVTATAADGYAFSHFSGTDGDKTAQMILTMDADRQLTAHFVPKNNFDGHWLTLESNVDTPPVTLDGTAVRVPYTRLLAADGTVTLSAADTEELTFLAWLDGEGSVITDSRDLMVTLDTDRTYTAYYSSQVGTNLVAGKTMTVSSSVENAQYGAKRATDGTTTGTNGFSTLSDQNGQTEYWVSFDLGVSATVSRFVLYNRSGNNGYGIPVSMDIYRSDDGAAWTKTQTFTRDNVPLAEGSLTVDLESFTGRYIKIQATDIIANPKDGSQKRFQFSEIEVYGVATGENYALGAAVSYATVQCVSSQWCPYNLTDGETASKTYRLGYTSTPHTDDSQPEWVEVDLTTAKDINRVVLTPVYQTQNGNIGYSFPEDYTLQVSEDGKRWKTMKKVTGAPRPTEGSVLVDFPVTAARYVRLTADKLRAIPMDENQKRLQLAEMQVYLVGDAADPVLTANPEDVRARMGDSITFAVEAKGSDLTYRWESSADGEVWNAVYGGDSAALTVTATAANTFHRFRCVVTSGGRSVTSESAVLQAYSAETVSDNLALSGTVTLSTGQDAAALNNGVTDPAVDTVQTADNPTAPAVTVAFSEPTEISRVVLYAGTHGADALPTAYTVEVSDGGEWHAVAVNTDYRRRTNSVLTIDFATVTAEAVRITADRLQGYAGISGCTRLGLSEVEVYRVGAEIVRGGIPQQSVTADSAHLLENRVNLAQGKTYFAYVPATGVKDTVKTLPDSLTDGKIVGVNATDATTKAHEFITSFKWPYQETTNPADASDAWIVIDLGEAKSVGNVLLGQGQDNHINGKIWRGYVYVGDSVDTLFTDAYKVAEYHYETADGLPASIDDLGVLMAADKVRTGRYVGIRVPMNGAYWGASPIGFRTSEIGIYAPDAYMEGAQLRQREDGDAYSDLRFGVEAQVSGAAYRTVDGNPYYADLTDAVFTLSGTAYTVVEMGTLVARKSRLDVPAETALTLSSDVEGVEAVSAQKLYSIGDSTVTYTAVVTNIPQRHRDEVLVARPYVKFLISGSEATADAVYVVYYGDILERSVNAVSQ